MRVRLREFTSFGWRLAASAEAPVNAYDLGREVGVPSSTVGDWLRQLRFHRALVTGRGGEFVDVPRLYAFYTAHRVARVHLAAEVSFQGTAGALSERLDREGIPHVLAMLTAANAWAFYEDRRDVQLYVNRGDVKRVRDLVDPGPHRLQLFTERLPELPTARRERAVTDPFLTMIDCRAHPEGGAHADFLDRNVIRKVKP